MGLLTESKIRSELRDNEITEYRVSKKDIITPSARAFLSQKNIKLIIDDDDKKKDEKASEIDVQNKNEGMIPRFENIYGGYFENKPEFMTSLSGNKLVYKDHPKIELRGQLDSVQADILQTQFLAHKGKKANLVKDLDEVLSVIRNIMKAEILNEELIIDKILGMTEDEIRATSHNPKKYLGVEHDFYPKYDLGECYLALNSLRTRIRVVEISAIKAFKDNYGSVERIDILKVLNRLSSCFYVMMLRLKAGHYK